MSYGLSLRAASTMASALPSDPVRLIMTYPPATVDDSVTLREAAEQLAAEEIGALLVVGESGIGILSERDLVAVIGVGRNLENVQAGEVLNAELVWASPEMSIREAGQLMLDAGVRHLPVGNGVEAVGIVSVRDVLGVLVAASSTI